MHTCVKSSAASFNGVYIMMDEDFFFASLFLFPRSIYFIVARIVTLLCVRFDYAAMSVAVCSCVCVSVWENRHQLHYFRVN